VNPKKISLVVSLLKTTYGLLFLIAGLDKFFNTAVHWGKHMSGYFLSIIPLDMKTLIFIIGLFEIFLGILIFLPKWTKTGSLIASVLLIFIALNLISLRSYYDLALCYIVMAIGALALSILTSTIQHND